MRIFCLTSYTKREFDESYMRIDQYDFYIPILNGCEKYALTEIFVGKCDVNFEFHVFREDFGIFRYLMKKEMLEAVREGNNYIDVEIGKNNGFGLQSFVKKIRIRCVKADSSRKLTAAQKEYFNDYAETIEEYANGDRDLREEAFNSPGIQRFNLANPVEDNNRMSDLMNAFNGLCHESKQRISNRYNQNIDSNINIHYHALNDKRISIIKDFTKTKEIKLFRSKLPKINPKWFNATNLDTLDLSRVYPFDFDEAGQWKIFADGIKNCQKLKSLTFHDCGIEEIPDSVFGALPESLITLSLGDNNIKRISPKISRLKNLYALNVSYNPELSDEGFPWKFLPETLHMLDLSKTDLKQIPSDVERLKELERLIIGKSVAYIKWKCLPQSLDELTVDGDGKLNILRSMQRFYLFRVLGLRNAGLKPKFLKKHLSSMFWLSHVDLSFNNFGKFVCPNIAHGITRLFLNNCNLSKVCWIDIWRCLPSLRRLELRNNQITEVKFYLPEFDSMALTHVDLENNKIKKLNGYFLPDSITHLNLVNNEIAVFKNIDLLIQLSYLWIDNNHLKEFPVGIEKCKQLNGISVSNNFISSIPEGFEGFETMLFLVLSHNNFLPYNLDTCLWNRLPKSIEFLKISNNNLGEIPCKLSQHEIRNLEANDCHLKHICPRYGYLEYLPGYLNHISVKQNVALKHLSFVPTKILSVPKTRDEQKKEEERTKTTMGRLILTTDTSFRDTSRWKTEYKIHDYDFILKQNQEKLYKCQCCARCGTQCSDQLGIIETYMVMDFTQIVETPTSETNTGKEAINEFRPGEWKTLVKTKMCTQCIDQIKLDVLLHYDDIPLEHKIRERDNKVIDSGAFTEAHPEVESQIIIPIARPFSLPFQNSKSHIAVPEWNNEHPSGQMLSGLNDHESVEEYTQMDGSIHYEVPQQQTNFFYPFYMDMEERIFNSGVSVDNELQNHSGQHLNWSESNQQYYSNQFNPMEVSTDYHYQSNENNIQNGVMLQNLNNAHEQLPYLQNSFYSQNNQQHPISHDSRFHEIGRNYIFTDDNVSGGEEIVFNAGGDIPEQIHLDRLLNNQYLDDVIIMKVLQALISHDESRLLVDTIVWNEGFVARYWNPERRHGRLPTVPYYSRTWETALVPINITRGGFQHWTLAIIVKSQKAIIYFDPMKRDIPETHLRKLCTIGQLLVGDLCTFKNAEPNSFMSQFDGYNCGVIICLLARSYLQNSANFFTKNQLSQWRQRVHNWLQQGGNGALDLEF